jgi:hypothetical protein
MLVLRISAVAPGPGRGSAGTLRAVSRCGTGRRLGTLSSKMPDNVRGFQKSATPLGDLRVQVSEHDAMCVKIV